MKNATAIDYLKICCQHLRNGGRRNLTDENGVSVNLAEIEEFCKTPPSTELHREDFTEEAWKDYTIAYLGIKGDPDSVQVIRR